MTSELQLRMSPKQAATHDDVVRDIASKLNINTDRIKDYTILKRSIDARQRNVMVNLKVLVWIDNPKDPNFRSYVNISYPNVGNEKTAIVVGAGPAGLFAALRLIESGIKPILLERGKPVDERRLDIAAISRQQKVDPDSNYCFGEGGAGAFSDGKLYTRSKKRGNIQRILQIFHQHGAADEILIDAHPHIGSDRLPHVISNMRHTIIKSGGEVLFNTKVTSLIIDDGECNGVETADGKKFFGPVILATGHSARDVYHFLKRANVKLEAKGIAIGVRLEHPQHLIDCIQYHSPNGRGEYLPAAEYSFSTQVDGRGVYSFCMCPGGVIIPASCNNDELVVNGMSASARNSHWANSGMVVEIHPEDIPEYAKYGEFSMMRYQEDIEKECFRQADNSLIAGAQRMKDFVEGKASKSIPPSSYPVGVKPSRLDKWLPSFIATRLQKGFRVFGRTSPGFLTNEAIVIGVESRTSSPVRIPRDTETYLSNIKGLYPAGEGAGYAGGIVSAAIDGENCALRVAESLKNDPTNQNQLIITL